MYPALPTGGGDRDGMVNESELPRYISYIGRRLMADMDGLLRMIVQTDWNVEVFCYLLFQARTG